jgi:hypothetical protein
MCALDEDSERGVVFVNDVDGKPNIEDASRREKLALALSVAHVGVDRLRTLLSNVIRAVNRGLWRGVAGLLAAVPLLCRRLLLTTAAKALLHQMASCRRATRAALSSNLISGDWSLQLSLLFGAIRCPTHRSPSSHLTSHKLHEVIKHNTPGSAHSVWSTPLLQFSIRLQSSNYGKTACGAGADP